ncbi:MAG: twin-arginine translocase TatA/TatE family subunit [Anaerolineales bacterium]|jgi:sec-independent protein translocase protein TatA|nr:twin-arginine translocase TatA/TatE family subunit [Anaerolineales bacterium]
MPFRLGTPELIIILVIVLLIFGTGRITKVAGELGKGIKEFRSGLKENEQEASKDKPEPPATPS